MLGIWGGWVVVVSSSARGNRAKDSWTWRSPTGANAKSFLIGIRPYLRMKHPQCDNALEMIELLTRSRRTLGPHPLPQAWLEEQEKHYWLQRELNHRGTDPFERKAMHSPRKIHRERQREAAGAK